ncbi:alpha/beta hydrolase [Companilactobacillus sp. RD055328]|uniref:alpha/beta hydrolase n=1 Tax=Companilactobacillus sp. RD055328 TaxID=2916634 RepID=UPI001FC8874A|nr:alpha/beta hydrolase [Companilactobacillus sp. RD055328]GKQ43268.1 alpha/beta hydrolase [Companilactobacillus sp. RD055328]
MTKKNHLTSIPQHEKHLSDAQVPTLFVHGFRGGDYTTEKMVLASLAHTDANDFLKATIDGIGRITYEGTWTANKYPLVQIVFKEKWTGAHFMAYWIVKVLKDLSKNFEFEKYYAVGHSLGAVALVLAEINAHSKNYLPKIDKLVLVAGPFSGVIGLGDLPNVNRINSNGRPTFTSPTFIQLRLTKNRFPKNVDVINIFGNVNDFSNSDKYVSVTSARSISYILKDHVRSYEEVEIIGNNGEHSQMHDDTRILDAMVRFLF